MFAKNMRMFFSNMNKEQVQTESQAAGCEG